MQKQDAEKQGGWFEVGNRNILGELTFAGEHSHETLIDADKFAVSDENCLFGTLHDLKKISLIGGLSGRREERCGQGERRHLLRVHPQYILIGDRHLGPNDAEIERVSQLVDDAEALFPDHDAFGMSAEPNKTSLLWRESLKGEAEGRSGGAPTRWFSSSAVSGRLYRSIPSSGVSL
jgi:hypothetical protein